MTAHTNSHYTMTSSNSLSRGRDRVACNSREIVRGYELYHIMRCWMLHRYRVPTLTRRMTLCPPPAGRSSAPGSSLPLIAIQLRRDCFRLDFGQAISLRWRGNLLEGPDCMALDDLCCALAMRSLEIAVTGEGFEACMLCGSRSCFPRLLHT